MANDSSSKQETSIIFLDKSLQYPLELTAPRLEAWFAESELLINPKTLTQTEIDASTPNLAMEFLSHFGMKSAQEVLEFLESPGGKITLGLYEKEILALSAVEDKIQKELIEETLQKERFMSYLLLGLLDEREAQLDETNQAISFENYQHLRKEALAAIKARENALHHSLEPSYEDLNKRLDAYTETIRVLEHELNEKLAEASILEQEQTLVEANIQAIDDKYDHYEQHIHDAYEEIKALEDHTAPSIERQIHALDLLIQEREQKIAQLLVDGHHDLAHESIEFTKASYLKRHTFEHLLAGMNKTKAWFTSEGLPTDDFHEADFILARTKKIVQHHGKYYLINADQAFDDLSTDEKKEGAKAFDASKAEIMGSKRLLQHQRSLEHKTPHETKEKLSQRAEMMQKEMAVLANQLTQTQAARANVERLLQEMTKTQQLRPQMSPLPTTPPASNLRAMATASSSKQCLTRTYQHMLSLMKDNPSERAISWLQETVQGMANTSPELKKQMNALVPGRPIPPALLKLLLSRPGSPGNTLVNPNAVDYVSPEAEPSEAPTPLSMNPFKQ